MRALRRHLLDERGVPRDDLSVSGYWRRGDDEEGFRVFKAAERDGDGLEVRRMRWIPGNRATPNTALVVNSWRHGVRTTRGLSARADTMESPGVHGPVPEGQCRTAQCRKAGSSSGQGARGAGAAGKECECSRGSPTEQGGLSSWPKKRPGCSTTTTSAPSTSSLASSTRAREWPRRPWSPSGSPWRASVSRSRRSSARASRRRAGTSRSRRGPRRSWSCPCARRSSSATTTSAPSTSCSA